MFITKGNLFELNRLQEIWKMNSGQYDYLLESYSNSKENLLDADC